MKRLIIIYIEILFILHHFVDNEIYHIDPILYYKYIYDFKILKLGHNLNIKC